MNYIPGSCIDRNAVHHHRLFGDDEPYSWMLMNGTCKCIAVRGCNSLCILVHSMKNLAFMHAQTLFFLLCITIKEQLLLMLSPSYV